MQPKIYLAASYTRKYEVAKLAKRLESIGCRITSTWFDEGCAPNSQLHDLTPSNLLAIARRDLEQISTCNALVVLSDAPKVTRGGHHFEFGWAYHKNRFLYLLGPREIVFHYLSDVRVASDVDELITLIRRDFSWKEKNSTKANAV